MPFADVLTPNIPEAEALNESTIGTIDDALRAAETMLTLGPKAVVVKAGHLSGAQLQDWLVTHEGPKALGAPRQRQKTPHTHGTGCALASALATGLAQGLSVFDSAQRAVSYVDEAIRHAPGLGQGYGPLGHGFNFKV